MLQQIEHGNRLMEQLRFHEAEEAFRSVIKDHPQSVDAGVFLIRLLLMRNNSEEASMLISRLLSSTSEDARLLMLRGICLMQKTDFSGATISLEKAAELDPGNAAIEMNLARCYRKLNRLDEAEKAARRSISLDPRNYRSHFELAGISLSKRNLKECVEQIRETIRLNPMFFRSFLVLGNVFERAGKLDQAIKVYRKGLTHNPLAFPLQEALCRVHASKGDYPAAFIHAVKLARGRNHYGDYLRLGTYSVVIGQLQLAEKAFQKAIELNPQSWEAHYNLAELYHGSMLKEKAMEHYLKAIEINDEQFKPHNGLGLLYMKEAGNIAKAKRHFAKACDIAPSDIVPLYNMILACAGSNDWEEARTHLESALKLAVEGDAFTKQLLRIQQMIEKQLSSHSSDKKNGGLP